MNKKKDYKVIFCSGLELNLTLNQWELKEMIRNYKIAGYVVK